MYARKVVVPLKANSVAEFTQTLEKEIIPLLRKQKGFQDEITCLVSTTREAVGISFWDTREDAEAYSQGGYPEVLRVLAKVLAGTPHVQTLEVLNSTIHKIAPVAA